eukprot:gene289-biopygen16592
MRTVRAGPFGVTENSRGIEAGAAGAGCIAHPETHGKRYHRRDPASGWQTGAVQLRSVKMTESWRQDGGKLAARWRQVRGKMAASWRQDGGKWSASLDQVRCKLPAPPPSGTQASEFQPGAHDARRHAVGRLAGLWGVLGEVTAGATRKRLRVRLRCGLHRALARRRGVVVLGCRAAARAHLGETAADTSGTRPGRVPEGIARNKRVPAASRARPEPFLPGRPALSSRSRSQHRRRRRRGPRRPAGAAQRRPAGPAAGGGSGAPRPRQAGTERWRSARRHQRAPQHERYVCVRGGGMHGKRSTPRVMLRLEEHDVDGGEQDSGAGVARAWRGRGGYRQFLPWGGAGVVRAWRGHVLLPQKLSIWNVVSCTTALPGCRNLCLWQPTRDVRSTLTWGGGGHFPPVLVTQHVRQSAPAPAGRNGCGRVPDASRMVEFYETDACRTRPEPLLADSLGSPGRRPGHRSQRRVHYVALLGRDRAAAQQREQDVAAALG